MTSYICGRNTTAIL